MTLVCIFWIAFGISLLGSIPIGMITLAITERSISRGFKAGLILSLGATIMEFVYTFLAISCLEILTNSLSIGRNIKMASVIIFSIVAVFHLLKKTSPLKSTMKHSEENWQEFLKGIGVGALNFLIIPYWIFIGVWLKSNNIFIEERLEIIIFASGAALGALVVFVGYGKLAVLISNKMEAVAIYTNKVVGILFLTLAIIQVLQML